LTLRARARIHRIGVKRERKGGRKTWRGREGDEGVGINIVLEICGGDWSLAGEGLLQSLLGSLEAKSLYYVRKRGKKIHPAGENQGEGEGGEC